MAQEKKRVTLGVFDGKYGWRAREIAKYLQSQGVDVKVVTKHAVQVAPGQETAAAKLITKDHPEWLKKPDGT